MLELAGKYDSFGVSWTPYDYGVCSECGNEIVKVKYPKGFLNGENNILYVTEMDFLCLVCGTSVTEKKGEEINYDKRALMSEINGKVSELNPKKRDRWWVKNSCELG
ncbi:MAG: hypothetical protein DRP06_01940 [Candidatus Aenigmatarchaeota archaeon]|nr:MAG: hypothetical protein DRP06_01940 [Candidatus Aenigmarchaeota archaeon]